MSGTRPRSRIDYNASIYISSRARARPIYSLLPLTRVFHWFPAVVFFYRLPSRTHAAAETSTLRKQRSYAAPLATKIANCGERLRVSAINGKTYTYTHCSRVVANETVIYRRSVSFASTYATVSPFYPTSPRFIRPPVDVQCHAGRLRDRAFARGGSFVPRRRPRREREEGGSLT